jgi:hypothetical protein
LCHPLSPPEETQFSIDHPLSVSRQT